MLPHQRWYAAATTALTAAVGVTPLSGEASENFNLALGVERQPMGPRIDVEGLLPVSIAESRRKTVSEQLRAREGKPTLATVAREEDGSFEIKNHSQYMAGQYNGSVPAPLMRSGVPIELMSASEGNIDGKWVADDWLGDGYCLLEYLHRDLLVGLRDLEGVEVPDMTPVERAFLRGVRQRQRLLWATAPEEALDLWNADSRVVFDSLRDLS